MRAPAACCCLALAACAGAQPGAPGGQARSLFLTVKPQVTVVVREHNTGADLVEMTLLDPHYPPEVLQSQIATLGALLNSKPRGLHVYRQQILKDLSFIKATFAVDGLVDPQKGLRLAPIVKALAGAPGKRALRGMSIIFEGQAPNERTVRRFASPAVEVEAQADPGFGGIEYRVRLLTQDPARIDLPDGAPVPVQPAVPVPKPPRGGVDWTLIALFGVAAIAVGALVYSLLLRARPREHSPR